MAGHKPNGYVRWISIAIAVLVIAYNTIVTHIVLKNDVEHLVKREEQHHVEQKAEIRELRAVIIRHIEAH